MLRSSSHSNLLLGGVSLSPGEALRYDALTVSEGTHVPGASHHGDAKEPEEWLPLVYEELRCLAHRKLAVLPPGQTLQSTALVHEAWLRLSQDRHPQSWNSRAHFFSAAAEAMRRILIERARSKAAKKHGGGLRRVYLDLDHVDLAEETNSDLLLLVDGAVARLAKVDSQAAELVKLRFFAGLPNVRAAEVLGMSERTAKRNWAYARAWLYHALQKEIDPA